MRLTTEVIVLSKTELRNVDFADTAGPPWRKGSLYYLHVARDRECAEPVPFYTEDRALWDKFSEGDTCRMVLEK